MWIHGYVRVRTVETTAMHTPNGLTRHGEWAASQQLPQSIRKEVCNLVLDAPGFRSPHGDIPPGVPSFCGGSRVSPTTALLLCRQQHGVLPGLFLRR